VEQLGGWPKWVRSEAVVIPQMSPEERADANRRITNSCGQCRLGREGTYDRACVLVQRF
jgi:hypothetical protein